MKNTVDKIDLKHIAVLTPKIEAGAIKKNVDSVIECVGNAAKAGAKIAVLPLNIIAGDLGIFPSDVFKQQIGDALNTLKNVLKICCCLALNYNGHTPIVIDKGQIYLSNFHTTFDGISIYIAQEFCVDTNVKADIIAVPSSYPAFIRGAERVLPAVANLSKQTKGIVACASNGNGNSAYKFVRSADKIIARNGLIYGFEQSDTVDCLQIKDYDGFAPCGGMLEESWIPSDVDEVLDIVSRGVYARMKAAKAQKLVLGLSGGLDSTSSLIFAAHTADKYSIKRQNIIAVRMPSKESGQRTQSNSEKIARLMLVDSLEIPISVDYRLERIKHNKKDVVYENAQARERAAVLLDLANKENALVLGTSDLTEIALGFSTYGGDQLAHYNPNSGLTKLAIRAVVSGFAQKCGNTQLKECLNDILATPYSPELKPNQSSEQILGPYEVFEFFLLRLLAYKESKNEILNGARKEFLRINEGQIEKYYEIFIKRFFSGRFKHNFSCDGIALLPFDLSFFELNCDLNPEFLL